MLRPLRLLCLWLVALALPVQGFAAAAMVHCGAARAAAADAVAARGGHGVEAASRHHGDGADRGAPSAQAADPHAGHHPAAGTVADLHKLTKSKCASCASCCAAMALPSALPRLDSPPLAESLAPVVPGAVAVFLTDGPERPPRFLLA